MNRTLYPMLAVALIAATSACNDASGGPNNSTPIDANNVEPNNVDSNSVTDNSANADMMLPLALQLVVDESCVGCHTADDVGPYDFTDPHTVVALGDLIVNAVEARTMPPWHMDSTCAEVKGDLRLTDAEIALFTQWREDGKPIVPREDYEQPVPRNDEIGDLPTPEEESLDLMIPAPYTPVFGRLDAYPDDDFRCFVVDPGFDTKRQMTGFEMIVGNKEIDHHMVMYTTSGDPENLAALAELEAEDDQPGFSCFALSRFEVEGLAAVWAPGVGRVGYPYRGSIRTATPVDADTRFVIQMHYNKPVGDIPSGQSGVRIWLHAEGSEIPEIAEATWAFIGNQPFRVPAGVDGTNVPDDQCDIVFDIANLSADDTPISWPSEGFYEREVRCGIGVEDCEAENGVGSEACAIDYTSRLELRQVDMEAVYTVTIAGNEITYDASASGAATITDIVDGLAAAINDHALLDGVVEATAIDRDQDGTNDALLVSNRDGEATVYTEAFAATGEADVRLRQVDACSQYDPQRLVEARSVGSSGCVQMETYYRNPAALTMWSAFSHMHYLGKSMETIILPSEDDGIVSTAAEEQAQCASRTNNWDFDWQRTYWLQEEQRIPVNGVVRQRCRFDNSGSMEEVRLGEGSGSEMCLAVLYLTP